MNSANNSSAMDWIIFWVSTIIMIVLLVIMPEWFWLALPFSLTYLAKAFKVI